MADPPRRLLNHLPGYDDSARDLYETPAVAEAPSENGGGTDADEDEEYLTPTGSDYETDDGDDSGISRRRLFPAHARTRFGAPRVEIRRVDLSDRVDGRRKGYEVWRRKDGVNGAEEDESLEQRLARLRREIEECRVLAENEGELDFGGREEGYTGEVDELGKLIGRVEARGPTLSASATGRARGSAAGGPAPGSWPDADAPDGGEATDAQLLSRVADFDTRLSALEQSLGISALDAVTSDSDSSLSTPVLPSLTLLDSQLAALTSASSLTSLDTAAARVQKLKAEAAALSQAPSSQPTSRPPTANSSNSADQAAPTSLTAADLTNLRTLYTLLPTLQSLTPTVPSLLERLRSLRTLHASAASAANELDEAGKRLEETEKELRAWKSGLEQVEAAVKEAGEANGRNGKVVEGWVRELEARVGR